MVGLGLNAYDVMAVDRVRRSPLARRRARVEPDAVPQAIRYYRELERRSTLVFRITPYRDGAEPVRFNFDWTFDYYPLAYHRPGPEMWVYRLEGGECGRGG